MKLFLKKVVTNKLLDNKNSSCPCRNRQRTKYSHLFVSQKGKLGKTNNDWWNRKLQLKFNKMSVEELNGSELGTKEYWEKSYQREIRNYKNHGDVGEIWFDEDSQLRVVNWIMKRDEIADSAKIIDLGCGNGMLLVELAREGYTNLVGIDYSPKAVELASNIAKDQELNIKYEVADLLNITDCQKLGTFNVIHDKGTYDAISLNPENPKEKRESYLDCVGAMMDENAFFIITSCNWTEEELVLSFNDKFDKFCTIPTPTFKFGGKVGSVVTSLVFKKKR